MARPGLFSHRKFRHLARTLNDEALAVGTLECLWFAASETCDPRIGDDRDVEIAARWKGAPGVLVPALLAAGFLDRDPDEGYVVHNYWDHAPEYVLKRRAREAQRRASVRRNGAAPTDAAEVSGQTAAICPDKRPPSEQFRAVQSRAEQNSSEQDREGAPRGAPSGASPAHITAFVEAWNAITSLPIRRCREITPRRRQHIAARLRERPLEEWRHIFERIAASSFCRGETERGWIASIDFVLKPDTAAKVLEGTYDDHHRRVSAKTGGNLAALERFVRAGDKHD